jgi:hypothetical protein
MLRFTWRNRRVKNFTIRIYKSIYSEESNIQSNLIIKFNETTATLHRILNQNRSSEICLVTN